MDPEFWRQKRVLLTGHTGFKGAWLTLWLEHMGAEVTGLALEPPTEPSLFELTSIDESSRSVIGDIRDRDTVAGLVRAQAPEIVLHLAAQSLVRRSYQEPLETFSTNVMGTAKVLDAACAADSVRAVVVVTTDKCYEDLAADRGYTEKDRLGGRDPYAASKACAELVTAAYRSSFVADPASGPSIATARAGNVIGGGDWAADRLIPDILRAIGRGEPVLVRSPAAVRPWQHVLEPLAGYLELAERLHRGDGDYAEAWNFGPDEDDLMTVAEVADYMTAAWGDAARWRRDEGEHPPETHVLRLDSEKARRRLAWRPRLTTRQALDWTTTWHRRHAEGADVREVTMEQIETYEALTAAGGAATDMDERSRNR